MSFAKRRSFGPRIRLTDRQCERIAKRVQAGGLTCFIDQCYTGTVYVLVGLPEWDRNIRGDWYHTLDCGCRDDVAKIRLSGHEEGIHTDSTHNCVGTKSECLKTLDRWIGELIERHGPRGREILSSVPDGAELAEAAGQIYNPEPML